MTWLKKIRANFSQGSPFKQEGHRKAKAINKKDIPLNEQPPTATDSLAIKMDQIYKSPKFAHIGKGNWSDIAAEAKNYIQILIQQDMKVKILKGLLMQEKEERNTACKKK